MRLEEGKIYRDANGDKQGPLKDFGGGTEDNYGWSPPNGDWFWWNIEGKAEPGYDCVDLIAEWTEGPVRTVTRTVTETTITPGTYGKVIVGAHKTPGWIDIRWSSPGTRADELKAAAAVLLELAGALDNE